MYDFCFKRSIKWQLIEADTFMQGLTIQYCPNKMIYHQPNQLEKDLESGTCTNSTSLHVGSRPLRDKQGEGTLGG